MDSAEIARILAVNVKRLLSERGWNQTQLAERLDWSTGNLSRLLTGKHNPGADTLAQLVTAFGCELGDLLKVPAAEGADVRTPAKGKKPRKG